MNRLTKRGIKQEGMIWFIDHENNDIPLEPCEMNPHHNRVALVKLAKYEDLEEQCVKDNQFGLNELCAKWKAFYEDIVELLNYRKKQEQGLLIESKCTIGSIVYALWSVPTERKYVIYPAEVKEITFSKFNQRGMAMYKLEPISFRGRYHKYYDDDFGKLVFRTEDEAEEALAKMGGK